VIIDLSEPGYRDVIPNSVQIGDRVTLVIEAILFMEEAIVVDSRGYGRKGEAEYLIGEKLKHVIVTKMKMVEP
jgi:hypothetical protein